jgi:hypothetical protein
VAAAAVLADLPQQVVQVAVLRRLHMPVVLVVLAAAV